MAHHSITCIASTRRKRRKKTQDQKSPSCRAHLSSIPPASQTILWKGAEVTLGTAMAGDLFPFVVSFPRWRPRPRPHPPGAVGEGRTTSPAGNGATRSTPSSWAWWTHLYSLPTRCPRGGLRAGPEAPVAYSLIALGRRSTWHAIRMKRHWSGLGACERKRGE